MVEHPGVQLDDTGQLNEDLSCLGCGYNLRSLRPDVDCPECGAPLHDTIRLVKLRGFSAAWLKRTAGAMRWLGMCVGAMAVLVAFILCQMVFPPVGPHWHMYVTMSAMAIMLATGLVGFWRGTSPPAASTPLRLHTLRRLSRWCMTAAICAMVVGLLLQRQPTPADSVWWRLLGVGLYLMLAVGAWSLLMYGSRLARLIPNRGMAVQAKIVAWMYFAAFAGLATFVFLPKLLVEFGFQVQLVIVVTGIVIGLLLIASLWSLPLLWWYRRRFLEAARLADRHQSL